MRRFLAVCTILAVVCMMAFAGQHVNVLPSKAMPGGDIKAEIEKLSDQIGAAKAAGLAVDPAVSARLEALMPSHHVARGSLDATGDNCADPIILSIPAVLPYTDINTTCGRLNDLTGSCLGYWANGEDAVYLLNVTAATTVTIGVLSGGAYDYPAWAVDPLCPAGATCFAYVTSSGNFASGSVALTPGSYYLWIDNYPTPACISYTLTITGGGSGPLPGETCANPIALTIPGVENGNNCNYYDNLNAVCPYTNLGGRDVVYSFTPAVNEKVTFDMLGSGYDTKIYIFDGACTGTPIACNDDYYADYTSLLSCVQLTGGHTYYFVVDAYGGGDCGDYVLTTSICPDYPPPPNDNCANALPIVVNGPQICATTNGATLDCSQLTIPEIWYSFTLTECTDLVVSYCGTVASGSLDAVLFSGSCCGTIVGYSSYEFTTCADGLISLHFNHLAAGTYWLPVGFAPSGNFCVQLTGTPCPAPFVCHCQDVLDGRYCNLVGGPINDQSTVDYTVNVPIQYHITDVNVCLDLLHTWDSDMTIVLVSPLGTQVVLSAGNGSSDDNYTCTTFDDQATTAIGAGVAPFSGSFIPDSPLAAFNGENAMGDWHLVITDCCAGDVGTLNWFCVTFQWDQILAVQLANFAAVAGDNSVTLNWATASETNNDHFEIVRGTETVGRVLGHNGATTTNYTWTDGAAHNGTVYSYALVAVDVNGARREMGTVTATPSFNAASVTEYALHQNYPNPFNPTTSIALDLVDNGFVSLKVYNLMGQEVASLINGNVTSGRHIVSFDASSLSSGVYLYRLNVNGFSAEKKMLLMK